MRVCCDGSNFLLCLCSAVSGVPPLVISFDGCAPLEELTGSCMTAFCLSSMKFGGFKHIIFGKADRLLA